MTRYRGCGFTLIELLIVVAIIGILMAILLPSLSAARERAKRVVCASNIRDIGNGIWNYWTENNGRVPYVESPLTNGGLVPGFGNAATPDAALDPFDRSLWPMSLPNVLMPRYLTPSERTFVCPSAVNGWPREGERYRMTYRPAAANQPNGLVAAEGTYLRESFGFLDGRQLKNIVIEVTGDPIHDAMMLNIRHSTYVRDMIIRRNGEVVGPHSGGVNVLDRALHVEYRDRKTTREELGMHGSGAQF